MRGRNRAQWGFLRLTVERIMPVKLLSHTVCCTPAMNVNAYLEIAALVRTIHDPCRADHGYGSGAFVFRDRDDARRAEAIIKRHMVTT